MEISVAVAISKHGDSLSQETTSSEQGIWHSCQKKP